MASLDEYVIAEKDGLPGCRETPDLACTDTDQDARPSTEHVLLKSVGRYTAYAVDLEFLWRWEIYQESDHLVQDGASLSLTSATEAVGHVLAYFSVRDSNASS